MAKQERSDETRSGTMVEHQSGGRARAKGVTNSRFRKRTGERHNVTFVRLTSIVHDAEHGAMSIGPTGPETTTQE